MTLDVTATVWILTLLVIVALFALDLGSAVRRPHVPGFKESVLWSLFYIGVAVLFGIVFIFWAGAEFGAQFFAGYIVEKTLSIDNLFVFVIIMGAFAVPPPTSRSCSSSVSPSRWCCARSSSRWVPRCWPTSPSCS